ncbi:hypothetical protein D3C75_1059340 [compost metagenome]
MTPLLTGNLYTGSAQRVFFAGLPANPDRPKEKTRTFLLLPGKRWTPVTGHANAADPPENGCRMRSGFPW